MEAEPEAAEAAEAEVVEEVDRDGDCEAEVTVVLAKLAELIASARAAGRPADDATGAYLESVPSHVLEAAERRRKAENEEARRRARDGAG